MYNECRSGQAVNFLTALQGLHQEKQGGSSMTPQNSKADTLNRFDSYYATVVRETHSGCILSLELNDESFPVFAYGNYSLGDRVVVSVSKLPEAPRLPLVSVDSVISYATDDSYIA